MTNTTILGVKLNQRMAVAADFQGVLSKHGCQIKTRIGLHNVQDGVCSPSGVIILDVIGDDEQVKALETDISALGYAEIQKMVFTD